MILILSINGDHTTDEVMDWIRVAGGNCVRLNDMDIIEKHSSLLSFEKGKPTWTIDFNTKKINLNDVKIIWNRKFGFYDQTMYDRILKKKHSTIDLNQFLLSEYYTFLGSLIRVLSKKKWLFKSGNNLSKIFQLTTALEVGLKIPHTIITNNKSYLVNFRKKHIEVISKPIKDVAFFKLNGQGYSPYTELVEDNTFDTLDDTFFPSLIQGYVNKKFEVRSFFLDKKLYSMAIFSQNQKNTKTDFRKYNFDKPERYVPYQLPVKIELQLTALMKKLDLNTGSIDLIKDKKGDYYFLEVNPAGQFGMISQPCNYPLEKEVAKYLIRQDV